MGEESGSKQLGSQIVFFCRHSYIKCFRVTSHLGLCLEHMMILATAHQKRVESLSGPNSSSQAMLLLFASQQVTR